MSLFQELQLWWGKPFSRWLFQTPVIFKLLPQQLWTSTGVHILCGTLAAHQKNPTNYCHPISITERNPPHLVKSQGWENNQGPNTQTLTTLPSGRCYRSMSSSHNVTEEPFLFTALSPPTNKSTGLNCSPTLTLTVCNTTTCYLLPDQCEHTVPNHLHLSHHVDVISVHMSHSFSLFFVIFQSSLTFFPFEISKLLYMKKTCCLYPDNKTFTSTTEVRSEDFS